ncbi:hypothetical protein SAMN03159496_03184 [Rhizobium sp. NFR07]|uniref:PAS domain-containing protein n=1 Tax=Rhizobium sp. NFR07 TaxID=1566262 RepID=UPI0008EC6F52|nr:PAS domain-containing protein [Rhizobium sp. NFR07]SFB37077.1 hypothetical protein SAMN03159496_03184 [Rhizobium sp. NFR07]
MRTRATEEILNYWNGLRGLAPAPLRSDLDPSALRHFLPNLFIVAGSAPATLSFALAGTRICELFDRELRGVDYQTIWGEDAGPRPKEIIDNVLLYERAALLEVRLSPDGEDRPYDLLLMPLRTVGHVSDRVLGALIPRVPVATPRLVPVETLSLENWAFVEAGGALPRLRHGEPVSESPVSLLQRLIANSPFAQAGR